MRLFTPEAPAVWDRGRLQPWPGPAPVPQKRELPKVTDRSVKWVYNHLAETWDLLLHGYIRLLPMYGHSTQWPPVERGWLSLACPPGAAEVARVSVGQFREHLYTMVEASRLTGIAWEVSYGRYARGPYPPGLVVAHLAHARPPCLAGVHLPVRVRKQRDGLTGAFYWKVVSS